MLGLDLPSRDLSRLTAQQIQTEQLVTGRVPPASGRACVGVTTLLRAVGRWGRACPVSSGHSLALLPTEWSPAEGMLAAHSRRNSFALMSVLLQALSPSLGPRQ